MIDGATGISIGLLVSVLGCSAWVFLQLSQVREDILPRLSSMETSLASISTDITEIKTKLGDVVTQQQLNLRLEASLAPIRARLDALEKK